ncbi:MAG: hypothetical protein M1836_004679 [Candelina mexicana]|nr:MAG: hypothetical protein M1836_004679 [Candelina mexicana]
MVFANSRGHDFVSGPNLDILGILYILVCALWSILFLAACGLLYYYRNLPFIRIRDTTLVLSSLMMIHVYLCIILLVYPVNGQFSCSLEFWIMSIYLPFGIALFQAQNMQLLSLSCRQKQFMYNQKELTYRNRGRLQLCNITGMRQKWSEMTLTHRTYVGVAIGVVVQFVLTTALYLGSRRFHASFGTFGQTVGSAQCRIGAEWIPSAFWQMIWTFGFGPFLLFKIRKIQDVHRWNLQTTLCILSGLLGSPMWLATLYSPGLAGLGKYWPPPMWFAPGLMVMEFVTLYFPLMEAFQNKGFQQSTLAAIEDWERKRTNIGGVDSLESESTARNSTVADSTLSKKKNDMYSMQALEKALELNAAELLKFAAMKEFTGENIVFLTQVRDFKSSWDRSIKKGTLDSDMKRHLYNIAYDIFAKNVSLQTSQFPVNIEGKIYFALETMFPQVPGSPKSENIATPFNDDVQLVESESWSGKFGGKVRPRYFETTSEEHIVDRSSERPIPQSFDEHVFDRAEASVKYMVFTNTWVRFVDSQETRSVTSSVGGKSAMSASSFLSWAKK